MNNVFYEVKSTVSQLFQNKKIELILKYRTTSNKT